MTTETNNFVNGLEITDIQKNALLNNRLSLKIFNIEITKKLIKFDAITGFNDLERVSIERDMVQVWELFTSFRTLKNATNIMYALSEGRTMTDEIFENESKITPKVGVQEALTFNTFISTLKPAELQTLKEKVSEWYALSGLEQAKTFFELAYTNKNGEKMMNAGEYVRFTERTANYFARVLDTAPDGWVTIVGDGGTMTLYADQNPEIISGEVIPAKIKESIDKSYDRYVDGGQDACIKALESAMKKADRAKVAMEKFLAKEAKEAEKAAKAKTLQAEQAEKFNELNAMAIVSKDDIKTASTNLRASRLPKEQTDIIREKIKVAREALTAKPAEEVVAEVLAPAEPAKAPKAPRKNKADKEELAFLKEEAESEIKL